MAKIRGARRRLTMMLVAALLLSFCAPGGMSRRAAAGQTQELDEAERLKGQYTKLYKEGKYDEAIPLAERVLATYEKLLRRRCTHRRDPQ